MNQPTVVSLFSGAGGLDVGLEDAGFDVRFCCDIDKDCVSTLRRNAELGIPSLRGRPYLHQCAVEEADIASVSGRALRSVGVPLEVDLLVGGPPCQPFSSAGRMMSFRDPRGSLYTHFVRLADELRPKYVLFENVRGLVTASDLENGPGSALQAILSDFQSLGYRTNVSLLNLADFGGWQRRVRLFILMAREYAPPVFPVPTHDRTLAPTNQASLFGVDSKLPWRTLGEFLSIHRQQEQSDFCLPSSTLAVKLKDLPDGTGLRSAGTRESTRPGGHWGYRQGTFIADPQKPARTVTASSTQDWIRDPRVGLRRLTASECKLLQGFPLAWQFSGSRQSVFKQIGNAVPCLFGQVLGAAVREHRAHWYHDGFRKDETSQSVSLPPAIRSAIEYTAREQVRNGDSRIERKAKGIGSQDQLLSRRRD